MSSHNQFSINLIRQKSKAKLRLKSIRRGDKDTLSFVKGFHPSADELNSDNIQLADVQLALARELGLPSWARLKTHVQELECHKLAINNNKHALDKEISTLHVRCGHDIQERLKVCGFEGEFLPLIDPLCIGPIPSNETDFIEARAKYVADTLFPIMGREDTAADLKRSEQINLNILLDEKFKRIVFWIEHDSYDQLMLLRALTIMAHRKDRIIEIVELNDFPGAEKFIGLGQLPAEAIRSRWQYRRPVDTKLLNQAKESWRALSSGDPYSILGLLKHNNLDRLPNIAKVFRRLLQELPNSESGLSLTQHIALTVLKEQKSNLPFMEWFRKYQYREPLPFLGDIMFYALLFPLTCLDIPLLTINSPSKSWREQTFVLTPIGKECLSGRIKIFQEYWVASIKVDKNNQWFWDHQDLASLKQAQTNKST